MDEAEPTKAADAADSEAIKPPQSPIATRLRLRKSRGLLPPRSKRQRPLARSTVLRTTRTGNESTCSPAAVGQRAPGTAIADLATPTHQHDAAYHDNHDNHRFRSGKRSGYRPALQRLVENRPRPQHRTDDHLRWRDWRRRGASSLDHR
jgi:hypothetical protein